MSYLDQIQNLLQANGWEQLLLTELVSAAGVSPVMVQIRLHADHLSAPLEVVNIYVENIHSLEQIQQECFRALRTGRSGV